MTVLFDVGRRRYRVSDEDAVELIRHLRHSRRRQRSAALDRITKALLARGRTGNVVVVPEAEARVLWHVIGRWQEAPQSLILLRTAIEAYFRINE